MTDYSQNGEQAQILEALKNIERGLFLDIGAWNPKTFSNTRALFELGWTGVMVEPSPGPMRDLAKEYGTEPRITLVQAAVTVHPTPLVGLYISDDAVSTTSIAQRELWGERGGYLGLIFCPAIRPRDIPHPAKFDFISIDTEGSSVDLLAHMIRYEEPTCYCVEHDGRDREVAKLASEYGYRVEFGPINAILSK